MNRRNFLTTSGLLTGSAFLEASTAINGQILNQPERKKKWRLAMVGTGARGTSMWGTDVLASYSDYVEFVALCDINEGRVKLARDIIKTNCPVYTDFEKMMRETKPDALIVTTVDATHHDFIVRALELGVYPISEKPMSTEAVKIQQILDAEKRTGGNCRVTFNLRYSPLCVKLWQLLRDDTIGKLTSVDLHWYLDTSHGAEYFRRWHRLVEKSGSLWVHKASHHFDLLNWWIDSDPEEVFALGGLEHYGKSGPYHAFNCRTCTYMDQCKFYMDILKNEDLKRMYVENEKYDGYLRDGCVFKDDINIDDTMAATIKYANGVRVAYSLTTYSPYEGFRVSFNGTNGKIDTWVQSSNRSNDVDYDEIAICNNFGKRRYVRIPFGTSGHWGADGPLKDQVFLPNIPDPNQQCAGSRDGAFACLIGIAARQSIAKGNVVKIADLTTLKPEAKKEYRRV